MSENELYIHDIYARAGLIGNPSDGYHGKTISIPVRNYYARVKLWSRPDTIIVPHDKCEYRT